MTKGSGDARMQPLFFLITTAGNDTHSICYEQHEKALDITAFVLVFPPQDEDDKYCILPYFWVPEETLDLRVKRDHVPYDIWERQGYLETTEGNVIHYGYIEKFIENLGERFNIREIALYH